MAVNDGFQSGDFVQARLHGLGANGEDQWLTTEFTVTTVDADGTLHGCAIYPAGLTPAVGWGFELIRRALTMPDTLTQVDAVQYDDQVVRLFGMGNTWTDAATGQPADVANFKAFTHVN